MDVFVNANRAGPTEACGVVLRASAAWVRELLARQDWVRGLAREHPGVQEVVLADSACRFVAEPDGCDELPGGGAGWVFLPADEAARWETTEDGEFGRVGVVVSRTDVQWRAIQDWSELAVAETDPVGRDELEFWLTRLERMAVPDEIQGPPDPSAAPERGR